MESSRTSQRVKGLSPPRLLAGSNSRFFAFAAVHNLGHALRTVSRIYKIAAKAFLLGSVEALDEATAMEKAAAEFKVLATALMAIRR
jgi:hypothetical protein